MKKTTNIYYTVAGADGNYGLAERFDTIEDAIVGAEGMNATEKSLGYKPTGWIIIKHDWTKVLDDNGVFVGQTETQLRVH